jgi:hypothetical protein
MNKKFFLVASVAAITFLSSCLTSLHNLVTYTTVISDDRITGNWQHDDMTMKIETVPTSTFLKNMTSTKANGEEKKSNYDSKEDSLLYSRSYIVDFTKNNYRYYMVCCLTRIGQDLYADMEPIIAEPVNKPTPSDIDDLFNGGKYITTHSIAKVIFRGNELELRILNGDFIKEQLKNGTAAVKYEKDDLFATTLITASSDELRQFLTRYGNDERLYSSKNTITLKKT